MPKKARPRIDYVRRQVARTAVEFNSKQLVEIWKASSIKRLKPIILDSKFKAVNMATWRLILERSRIDKYRYVSDIKDCDNFAAALFGTVPLEYGVNTVGFVIDYSGRHAYNSLVYYDTDRNDLQIALVEPQNDKFVATGERMSSHEAYKATNGMVLWG